MKTAGLIFFLLLIGLAGWFLKHRPLEERRAPLFTDAPQSSENAVLSQQNKEPVSTNAPLLAKNLTNISSRVTFILSPFATYANCTQAIRELGCSLSSNDVAAIREFLLVPPDQFPDMRPRAFNSIKNDLLLVLMNQTQMPKGLGRQVVEMFNNPNADYMWREYCLQFMEPLWEKLSEDGSLRGEGRRLHISGRSPFIAESMPTGLVASKQIDAKLLREALFFALDERDQDLAGTALLGLNRLAKQNQAIDHNEVITKAIEIAEDSTGSNRCRLTALRVAAQAKNEEILPAARELAMSGQTDLLRGAAITTLGDFAYPQDRPILETIASTSNRQLKAAAKSALARMESDK